MDQRMPAPDRPDKKTLSMSLCGDLSGKFLRIAEIVPSGQVIYFIGITQLNK